MVNSVRKCYVCGKLRLLSYFKITYNGRRDTYCKTCRKAYNKAYRLKHSANPITRFSLKSTKLKNLFIRSIGVKRQRLFVSLRIKPLILKRDKYECQLCHTQSPLYIHHIIPVRFDHNSEYVINARNLITLCEFCHLRAHAGNFKHLDKKLALTLLKLVARKELVSKTILPAHTESK